MAESSSFEAWPHVRTASGPSHVVCDVIVPGLVYMTGRWHLLFPSSSHTFQTCLVLPLQLVLPPLSTVPPTVLQRAFVLTLLPVLFQDGTRWSRHHHHHHHQSVALCRRCRWGQILVLALFVGTLMIVRWGLSLGTVSPHMEGAFHRLDSLSQACVTLGWIPIWVK